MDGSDGFGKRCRSLVRKRWLSAVAKLVAKQRIREPTRRGAAFGTRLGQLRFA